MAYRRSVHGDIKAALDEVVAAKGKIIQHEADVEMRTGCGKAGDCVPQCQGGERLGREDFECALRLFLQPLQRSFLVFNLFEHLLAEVKMFRSSFSQGNPPGGSGEQMDA